MFSSPHFQHIGESDWFRFYLLSNYCGTDTEYFKILYYGWGLSEVTDFDMKVLYKHLVHLFSRQRGIVSLIQRLSHARQAVYH